MNVATLRAGARLGHRVTNLVLLVGVVVQIYLAGLAVFGRSFAPHAVTGWSLIVAAALATTLGLIGYGPRRAALGSLVQLVALILQPVLVFVISEVAIELAALHAVNALLIFMLGIYVERHARRQGAALDRREASSTGLVWTSSDDPTMQP